MKFKVAACTLLIIAASNLDAQEMATRSLNPKIVGGVLSKPDSRPWQVALVKTSEKNNYSAQLCGGTIIGEKEILTAAHCVIGKQASEIQVLSGTQSLKQGGKRNNVVSIIIHPFYNKDMQDSDIAILKLDSPPPNGRSIAIIQPEQELEYTPPNAAVTVVGWGNTQSQGEAYPTELLEVRIPIVPLQTCFDRFKKDNLTVTDNMICAGYRTGGKDSCQGDSGGPLVVDDIGGKKKSSVQVGIVSWGIGCALPENYGVYTRLARFSAWVNAQVPNKCTPEDVAGGFC